MGTSTSYTIPMKYFYEGHSYRVAIGATVGNTTTWSERTFNVKLSSARNTIIQRGNPMNTYSWTVTSNLTGWNGGKTYKPGNTYKGIPYSRTTNIRGVGNKLSTNIV